MSDIQTQRQNELADRLGNIVDQFSEAVEQGKSPDMERLLAENADLEEMLRPLLTAILQIEAGGLDELQGSSATPRSLGDFHLLREIGRGGMGIVYEAEQISLGRRVAVKVLPFAAGMDTKALERFRNEVRAAATLEHPHIVPVHAVGEERGVHFYAMKLIRGSSLADIIRELGRMKKDFSPLSGQSFDQSLAQTTLFKHGSDDLANPQETDHDGGSQVSAQQDTHSLAGALTESNRVDKDYHQRVAELGVQAASALAHAHDQGIVHRDIKPGNLILDTQGCLYITDFGLARIESVGASLSHDILGTPKYMSPEQAEGKQAFIDHRTDIYSLGITLYELLTQRPAFEATTHAEMLHLILHQTPERLRQRDRTIPVELETIIHKSISKDRDERYSTAEEFAEDLQRFLDQKPILARRPSIYQHAAKWTVRHRGLVTATCILSLLASAGLAISNAMIRNERNKAEAERVTANEERDNALEQEEKATRSLRLAQQAVDDFLVSMSEEELFNEPAAQPLRKRLLEQALAYYEAFVKEQRDDPELKAELASAYFRLAKITSEIGSIDKAIQTHWIGLELRQQLEVESPATRRFRYDVAESCNELGRLLSKTGNFVEAESLLNRSITITEELIRRDATTKYQALLAKGLQQLAQSQYEREHLHDATETGLRAVEVGEQLASAHPFDLKYQSELATSLSNLGNIQNCLARFDDAKESHTRALSIMRTLVEQRPQSLEYRSRLAAAGSNLAVTLNFTEDFGAAEPLIEEAIEIQTDLAKMNPDVLQYQEFLSTHYNLHADLLQRTERLEAAIEKYQMATKITKQLAELNPDVVRYQISHSRELMRLGTLLSRTGETDKGARHFEHAKDIMSTIVKENPSLVSQKWREATSHNDIYIAQSEGGEIKKAAESLQRYTKLCEDLVELDPSYLFELETACNNNAAFIINHRSNNIYAISRLKQAREWLDRAKSIIDQMLEAEPNSKRAKVALILHFHNLGVVQKSLGQTNEASSSLHESISLSEQLLQDHPQDNGLRNMLSKSREALENLHQ